MRIKFNTLAVHTTADVKETLTTNGARDIMPNMTTRSKTPKQTCEPAATIIREVGGPRVAAEIAGVATIQAYRWMWSEGDGGTGGYIPARRAQKLFDWARVNGKDLPAELFFGRVA
ncbi:MAG: hypothetical protein IPK82_23670 [Polyangiaceae bacterium]|nr:hypothetical protein [Polyangiaceae bacterium]